VKFITLILFPLVLLIGCSEQPDVIDEELYQKLLLELTIINQMDEGYLGELTREEFHEKILTHYEITAEQFRNSHEYYQRNIPQQLERMENLSIELRKERDNVQNAEQEYRRENREPADSIRNRILNRESTGLQPGEETDGENKKEQ
jgi:hypothetical protein